MVHRTVFHPQFQHVLVGVADERPLPCEVETSPFAFMLATAPASPDNIHPFAACRDERHDPVLDSALLEQNI